MVYNPNFDQPPLRGDEIVLTNEPRGRTTTGEIARISGATLVTGVAYTLKPSDNGKVIDCTSASPVTLTVPAGLGATFTCVIEQNGVGAVTPTASGTTIRSLSSFTATAGQYAVAAIVFTSTPDVYNFSGATA